MDVHIFELLSWFRFVLFELLFLTHVIEGLLSIDLP